MGYVTNRCERMSGGEMGNALLPLNIFPTTLTTTIVDLAVCVGNDHSCVILGDTGQMKCFGRNVAGLPPLEKRNEDPQ
eukprot:5055885-Amphidinium_carterae.5